MVEVRNLKIMRFRFNLSFWKRIYEVKTQYHDDMILNFQTIYTDPKSCFSLFSLNRIYLRPRNFLQVLNNDFPVSCSIYITGIEKVYNTEHLN